MSLFKPPSPLNLEGNVAGNWRKWKQRIQLYMEASGSIKKPEKQQVAIFLHLIGEEALEIYNTFSLSTENKEWLEACYSYKTCSHPSFSNCDHQWNSLQANRRYIIKTPDVNKDTIASPTSDRGITKSPGSHIIKTPDIIRTRSGRTVRPPRLNDFEYY